MDHDPRKILQSLATMAARQRQLPATEPLGERLKKWGVQPGDPDAASVRRRLARSQLSAEDQFWLFEAAERIAAAERAKAAWNPKAKAAHYLRLCKLVTAAARLNKDISTVFLPPWTDDRARIGLLVAELAAFIEGDLTATMIVNKSASVSLASATVRTMKQHRPPESRLYWELLQDLIWLVSAKTAARISERSVRRYVDAEHVSWSPVRAYWRRNFKLIQEGVRNPPQKPASPKSAHDLADALGRPLGRGVSEGQRKAIEAFSEIARKYVEEVWSPEYGPPSQGGEKAHLVDESCRDAEYPQLLTWLYDDPATEPLRHARSADRSRISQDTPQKGSPASPASVARGARLDDRQRNGTCARL